MLGCCTVGSCLGRLLCLCGHICKQVRLRGQTYARSNMKPSVPSEVVALTRYQGATRFLPCIDLTFRQGESPPRVGV